MFGRHQMCSQVPVCKKYIYSIHAGMLYNLVRVVRSLFFCVVFCRSLMVSFSELENDTLNQAELNEIKINENN